MFYPLALKPCIKDYLWGGTRLKTDFGFACDSEKAAEAWMLACHKDGASTVINGEHAGKTLEQVLALWGESALGEKAAAFPYFPLLIKLIDAHDRLSIQVHPDNAYALKNEGEFGKTEMWYIVDCEPGAELIYGLNCGVTREEFRRRALDNTLTDICQFVPVHKGDVFFIPAGTLHAIGAGILVAEVQQNSNTTYRVSDYGRLGADGKPRALHVDKAADVTVTHPTAVPYGAVGEITALPGGSVRTLASCEFFTAQLLQVQGSLGVGCSDSFTSLLLLEGAARLIPDGGGEVLELARGASIFLPAGCTAHIEAVGGTAEILSSRV